MRQFVLLTDTLTSEQELQLSNALTNLKCAWFHWFPNSWLISTQIDALAFNVETLRAATESVAPNARSMVLEVAPINWSGRFRPDQMAQQRGWIHDYWLQDLLRSLEPLLPQSDATLPKKLR